MAFQPLNTNHPLNTNCYDSSLNALASLYGPPVTAAYSVPFPFAAVPQLSGLAAAAAAAVASPVSIAASASPMDIDTDESDEVNVLSKGLRVAKERLTVLKTQMCSADAGILDLENEMEELKAKMAEKKAQVTQIESKIAAQESQIALREKLLSSLKGETRETTPAKRKAIGAPSAAASPTSTFSMTPQPTDSATTSATTKSGADQNPAKKTRRTPPSPLTSDRQSLPMAAAASSASRAISHSSTDQILAEVYSPGTVVLYREKEATIRAFDQKNGRFIVTQDGQEFSGSKYELIYLPKVGEKILMKELPEKDVNKRLYEAEVVEIKIGGPTSKPGYKKNSATIRVKWLEFGSILSEEVNYRCLDKLLPLDPEHPISSKLEFKNVKGKDGAVGKGYYLSYAQQPQSST